MEQIPTETFADYMGNARNKFVNDIQQQKWNTELRTSAEDILIAYDQMRKRIEECEGKEKEIAELKDNLIKYRETVFNEWTEQETLKQRISSLEADNIKLEIQVATYRSREIKNNL